MPAKYQMSGRSLREIAGLQRQLNSRVQLGVRPLQSESVPHRLTGTTVDPQIPDQRRCISQVVRMPIPDLSACSKWEAGGGYYSITSFARASSGDGTERASVLEMSSRLFRSEHREDRQAITGWRRIPIRERNLDDP